MLPFWHMSWTVNRTNLMVACKSQTVPISSQRALFLKYSWVIDRISLHRLLQILLIVNFLYKYSPPSIKNNIASMGSAAPTANTVDFENRVLGCDLKGFISSCCRCDATRQITVQHTIFEEPNPLVGALGETSVEGGIVRAKGRAKAGGVGGYSFYLCITYQLNKPPPSIYTSLIKQLFGLCRCSTGFYVVQATSSPSCSVQHQHHCPKKSLWLSGTIEVGCSQI